MDESVTRHGGARDGAGRKPKGYQASGEKANFESARTRNELAKAEINEQRARVGRGEYLPRAAQQQAAATVLALLCQGLRSIPDNLERALSLKPDVVAAIEAQIDAALLECANGLKAMTLES